MKREECVQVVWFKRDLRVDDHAPLAAAAAAGPTLPLFVFEPNIWESPDMSSQHRWWVTESICELREELAALGQPLVVRSGDMLSVLEDLRDRFGSFVLWSHEETGNNATYMRDLAIGRWCRSHGITWHEVPQFGVIRRLRNRDTWSTLWEESMAAPLSIRPQNLTPVSCEIGQIPAVPGDFHPSSLHQLPGAKAAAICLDSFLYQRGVGYSGGISSPLTAAHHGSRLSPYLAWGNISMRRVVSETRARQAALRALAPHERGSWLRSLNAFDARLHWHCHFIQKLESEPEIEFECFVRAFNTMRSNLANEAFLIAWQEGRTGYPFVDACMRSLRATGWLNFRMRAMLVSFVAYDLFLDWRLFAHFLAQQFLDYEPGIHYPQIQMQSGTTGINAIRMYDPVKQGYDHDPAGEFVRRWVPELAKIPGALIHEPWKLSPLEQREYHLQSGITYPERIIDHREAVRKAREILTTFRREAQTKLAIKDTLQKHGSRSSPRRRMGVQSGQRKRSRPVANQLSLFGGSEEV